MARLSGVLRFLAVATLACVSLNHSAVAADRAEFFLMAGDQRLKDGEVCFFEATGDHNPFLRYLASDRLVCLPADRVIEIPVGHWNVYGVHRDGYISRNVSMTSRLATPGSTYKPLSLTMVPAGFLDLSALQQTLPQTDYLAVWVPNVDHPETGGYILPVSDDGKIAIPTEMRVYPMVVRGNRPYAVGASVVVSHRQTRVIKELSSQQGVDVIAWTEPASSALAAIRRNESTPPPVVALKGPESAVISAEPPRFLRGAPLALALFRGVTPGKYHLQIRGRPWVGESREVTVPPGARTHIIEAPLKLDLGATVIVRWNEGAPSSGAVKCPSPHETPTRASVSLLRCPASEDAEMVRGGDCKIIQRKIADLVSEEATVRFEPVPEGNFVVRFDAFSRRFESPPFTVGAGKQKTINIEPELVMISGRVTRAGKPVAARIEFATGAGVSDESGFYEAYVGADPLDRPITIQTCDSSIRYLHVPDVTVRGGTVYDIDIPSRDLDIHVVEAASGKPVEAADVYFGGLKNAGGDEAHYVTPVPQTNKSGVTTLQALPETQSIQICARKTGFLEACSAAALGQELLPGPVILKLARTAGMTGRIVSNSPFGFANVFVVLANGKMIESAPLAADGMFLLNRRYISPDALVVVSATHPLMVFRFPIEIKEEIFLHVPSAAVRNFEVQLTAGSGQPAAMLGLEVGGVLVPRIAFLQHQMRRNLPVTLTPSEPVIVRDILETGSIVIILGPSGDDVPPSLPPGADIFTFPEFASRFPRKVVPAGAAVVAF